MTGRVDESPLRRLVDLMNNFLPFAEEHVESLLRKLPAAKRNQRNQLTPDQRNTLEAAETVRETAKAQMEEQKQLMKIVDLVDQDLSKSPITDLVVQGDGVAGFVSASREFLTDDVTAGVLGGTFKVLGKVTAVDTRENARTPVVRRGVMGAISESAIEPMLEQMRANADASGLQSTCPRASSEAPTCT